MIRSKLLIIGAGGHGRVVADVATKMNSWSEISFLDDEKKPAVTGSINVLGRTNDVSKYIRDYDIFIAVGNNAQREKLYKQIELSGATIPTLIHPHAVIGSHVEIGHGTVLMAGVVINCHTSLGIGCIVNTGSTIDHDNTINDFVHISPGAHLAGNVSIGKHTWVGVGGTISNHISITSKCIIGAGAVVTENIMEQGTYVGVPARRIKK